MRWSRIVRCIWMMQDVITIKSSKLPSDLWSSVISKLKYLLFFRLRTWWSNSRSQKTQLHALRNLTPNFKSFPVNAPQSRTWGKSSSTVSCRKKSWKDMPRTSKNWGVNLWSTSARLKPSDQHYTESINSCLSLQAYSSLESSWRFHVKEFTQWKLYTVCDMWVLGVILGQLHYPKIC